MSTLLPMDPDHERGSVRVASREHIAAYLDATTATPEHADLIFVPGTRLRDPATIVAALLAKGVWPLLCW